VGDDRFWQALGSGTGSATVRRRVHVRDDSGQVSCLSRSWWSADRPWWQPGGKAALLFEVIPLAKYLVTGEHYVVVMEGSETMLTQQRAKKLAVSVIKGYPSKRGTMAAWQSWFRHQRSKVGGTTPVARGRCERGSLMTRRAGTTSSGCASPRGSSAHAARRSGPPAASQT